MEKTNMGETIIEGNSIVYFFDEESFKLNFLAGKKLIRIHERFDYIIGLNYEKIMGNGNLYKLSVPIGGKSRDSSEGTLIMATTLWPVDFYIEGYDNDVKFYNMVLEFPELQAFMDSKDLLQVKETKVILDREKKTKCEFDIVHNGIIVKAAFENYLDGGVGFNFAKCETKTRLVLTFPKTNDLEFLSELYYRIRGFFEFICNRKNIGLESVKLVGDVKIQDENLNEEMSPSNFKMVFNNCQYEENEKNVYEHIPSARLLMDKLPAFINLFFSNKVGEVAPVNANGIPASAEKRKHLDLGQTLHYTGTFENYVRNLLPEMHSNMTIKVYDEIRKILEEYSVKLTGKKKKKVDSIIKSIRPQMSLEDKIKKAYYGYKEWEPLGSILKDRFGENVDEYARVINKWRNELAHDKREYDPNDDIISAVRLVEYMNFCIVLRYAGYDDEIIKNSLVWLFRHRKYYE